MKSRSLSLGNSSQMEDPCEDSVELQQYQMKLSSNLGLSTPTIEKSKIDSNEAIKKTFIKKRNIEIDFQRQKPNIENQPKINAQNTYPNKLVKNLSSLNSINKMDLKRLNSSSSELPKSHLMNSHPINNHARNSHKNLSIKPNEVETSETPFKFLESLKNQKLKGLFSNFTKEKPESQKSDLRLLPVFKTSKEENQIQISDENENISVQKISNLKEFEEKEAERPEIHRLESWIVNTSFQELNVKFSDKFNIQAVPPEEQFKSISAYKCKKDILRDLTTTCEFKIECEEKKNDDIIQILSKVSSQNKLEQKKEHSRDGFFGSICGLMRRKKIGNCVSVCSFSPCGNFIALAFNQSDIIIFNIDVITGDTLLKKNKAVNLEKPESMKDVLELSWSCDSQFIAAIFVDSKLLQVWKINDPSKFHTILYDDIFLSIKFHTKTNNILLTGSFDKILRMWLVAENKSVDWVKTGDFITCIEFSPNSLFFVVGFLEGKFTVYEYKGHFNPIFTASLKDLNYHTEKIEKDENSSESRNSNGILGILFKKRLFNNKIVKILFPNKDKEDEFYILNYNGKLKLISKEKNYAILESYKTDSNTIPISIDCYNQLIILNSEYGPTTFWKQNNYYFPILNPVIFKANTKTNCSIENYWPFRSSDSMDYFVSFFLPKNMIEKYNHSHPNEQVEFFLMSLSCKGFVKIDKKLI